MASNAPGPCCVVGVKHEGDPKGTYKNIGNGNIPCKAALRMALKRESMLTTEILSRDLHRIPS
jgi:hypothetical protein